jgi:hypothetical protein
MARRDVTLTAVTPCSRRRAAFHGNSHLPGTHAYQLNSASCIRCKNPHLVAMTTSQQVSKHIAAVAGAPPPVDSCYLAAGHPRFRASDARFLRRHPIPWRRGMEHSRGEATDQDAPYRAAPLRWRLALSDPRWRKPESVAELRPHHSTRVTAETFDDALKVLGIHDLSQRQWVVARLDREIAHAFRIAAYSLQFWFPESKDYLAVGRYVDTGLNRTQNRLVRDACVYRTRITIAEHDIVGGVFAPSMEYRWRSVPILAPTEQGRRGGAQHRPAPVCDRCFVQLPASGNCDQCD